MAKCFIKAFDILDRLVDGDRDRPEFRGFVGRIVLRIGEFKRGLTVAEMMVSIELNFKDESAAERQEKLTQGLWQELKAVPGLKVDRVAEVAPDGSRSSGRFLWGLLQAEVGIPGIKTLFGFLGDRSPPYARSPPNVHLESCPPP